MELVEIKRRLREIRQKTYGKGEFDVHTIRKTEINAREAKILVNSYGSFPDIIDRFDAAIAIYDQHIEKHLDVSDDSNKEAIMHVESGIEKFFDRV